MSVILEIKDLTKTYPKARRPALDALSLQVESGAIYAFVGPNGAGKTTTIRIIATLLGFERGEVRLGGYSVRTQVREVRQLLGYIPDEFGLYDEMSASEYLEFFASCYGMPPQKRRSVATDLLDLVGLSHRAGDEVRTLSRGMRQRLGLARALVHEPALILADEPAAGLDPRARVELRDILRVLQELGKTIFISSHVLRELDDIATHVGILEQGRMVAEGTPEDIRRKLRPHRCARIVLLGPTDDAQAWLAQHPAVRSLALEAPPNGAPSKNGGGTNGATLNATLRRPELVVTVEGDDEALAALLAELIGAGFPVLSFTEERETLENLFLDLTQGIVS
ncbi:MAG: ABC transporter ATP-binding protein [Anaerolineae bacterium]|jgi:ABC-2 type transport system ATP-binding protein|nr:ABC transporter ATP-binding protein [Anaerolineae bacterium]